MAVRVTLLAAVLVALAGTATAQFFGSPFAGLPYTEPPLPYAPTSSPYDNPATSMRPTPTIPTSTDCSVRPQTIVEIKRMRRAASRIAQMIQTEVVIMEKRKAYVEQMTSYLNDRIRELNRVKGELEQEHRWIELSNQRILELAQKEKLIKMQDILACLNADQMRLQGARLSQTQSIAALTSRAQGLQASIAQIQGNIKQVAYGTESSTVLVPLPTTLSTVNATSLFGLNPAYTSTGVAYPGVAPTPGTPIVV